MKLRIVLSFLVLLGLVASGVANSYADEPAGDVATVPTADGIGTSPSIPDPDKDPTGFLSSVVSAAKNGQWRLVAACFLVALVWATRKWGARYVSWLATDRGGAVLVLCASLALSAAAWLSGEAEFNLALLFDALALAFTAAGSWSVGKKLMKPKDGGVIVTQDGK